MEKRGETRRGEGENVGDGQAIRNPSELQALGVLNSEGQVYRLPILAGSTSAQMERRQPSGRATSP